MPRLVKLGTDADTVRRFFEERILLMHTARLALGLTLEKCGYRARPAQWPAISGALYVPRNLYSVASGSTGDTGR